MEQAKNQAQAQALFNLEKRMEAARRAALRPFHSRTAEEVERELAQLNAEYEAVLAAAAETRLDIIEEARITATGAWVRTGWHSRSRTGSEYGAGYCSGGDPAHCPTCRNFARDAAAAERAAVACVAAAREGEWDEALEFARRAAFLEQAWAACPGAWGDCSTWGEFFDVVLDTIRDIADDAEQAAYAAAETEVAVIAAAAADDDDEGEVTP